jgi:hypothetical protein
MTTLPTMPVKPPPPTTGRSARLAAIHSVHAFAASTIAKLQPSEGERSAVKLSDLADPTFQRLPSGGEAITYTVQVLGLKPEQKARTVSLMGAVQQLYAADVWGEQTPGIINVLPTPDAGTFVVQFIW